MGCFVVAEFLLTIASRSPSAIAEPLDQIPQGTLPWQSSLCRKQNTNHVRFLPFLPYKSVLGVGDRSEIFFQYLKGRWHRNQFCFVPDLFARCQSISGSAGPIFTTFAPWSRLCFSPICSHLRNFISSLSLSLSHLSVSVLFICYFSNYFGDQLRWAFAFLSLCFISFLVPYTCFVHSWWNKLIDCCIYTATTELSHSVLEWQSD